MRKRTQCKGVFDVLTFGKDDEVGVHDDFYDSDDGGLDDVDDDINEKGHSMQRDVPSLCDVNHEGSYCLTSTFIITTLTTGYSAFLDVMQFFGQREIYHLNMYSIRQSL